VMLATYFREDGVGDYARYIGVGFTFVFIVVVVTGGGFLLDHLFGTLPLFLLLGLGAGFGASFYYIYLELKKLGGG
jgi:F0F1-type ATP synthase assembly protein I